MAGPPRATLTAEQKAAAADDHLSFRFVAGRKAGCASEHALEWLSEGANDGVLVETGPAVVVYRQESAGAVATGLIADLSLGAYEAGRVKRHERTIDRTQQKMADYMRTTRVHGNPPVTAVRAGAELTRALEEHTHREPNSAFTTVDGISHTLWIVDDDRAETLCRLVDTDLYITDGHHRLAAASLVAAEEGRAMARIPAGVFSSDELRLRSFARCVHDDQLDPSEVIARLTSGLDLIEVSGPDQTKPSSRYQFGAKIGDRFFRIRIPEELIPDDHYAALNTNLLQQLVLGPVLGVEDPRTDRRLHFVANLGNVVETCEAADVWLLPYPLDAKDVIAVADSGRTMPAKSTWFAPKLPSGLIIRPIGAETSRDGTRTTP